MMNDHEKKNNETMEKKEGKPEPHTGKDSFFDMYHFQNKWDAVLAAALIAGILFVTVLYFLFRGTPPA